MSNPLKILIAEDEHIELLGLEEMLTELGYDVIGKVMNGESLVKEAISKKPDLLVVDINLPKMSGIDAIKKINVKIFIPSIIITGYNSEETIKKANEVGVFNYLVKPVDLKELKPAIELAFGRYNELLVLKKELKNKEEALEARKYVEKAKGVLMEQNNLKEPQAMKLLQKMSRDKNKKLVEISKEIIEADKMLHYDY
ncbi:MAG: ANTAR domain-containing response regulator [Elusimicrobiota bacterium]